MLKGVPLYALVLTRLVAGPAPVAAGSSEAASARRFIQSFYDWYTAQAMRELDNPKNEDPLDLALRTKSGIFNPRLLKALREDRAAQQKNHDYIVGMDYDPFYLNQDVSPRYSVERVRRKGAYYWGYVHRVPDGKKVAECVAIAEVRKFHGQWRFENMIGADEQGDLLSDLNDFKQERLKSERAELKAKRKHR